MNLRNPPAVLPIAAASALLFAGTAFAKDYYVAPPGTAQSCTADGSQACPWVGLQAAFDSQKLVGGDRLLLNDGNYGSLNLWMVSFDSPLVVQSLNGKNARLEHVLFNHGVKNITLRNLSVWPTDPHQPGYYNLVESYTGSSNILVDGLDIRAGADAANYMSWSQSEWLARKIGGLDLAGPNSTVQNSSAIGTNGGFATEGSDSSILNNTVEGFSGDALRAIGSNSTVSGNFAKNCFQINDDHLDGFQSWAPTAGGTISGLTIEKNTIIEWTSPTTINPLHCSLQGVGLFDGPYYNVVISNNVISVTAPHGIGVYGGHNVQISNNTVVNNTGLDGKFPWIDVEDQKDGSRPSNVLVANNLAMSFTNGPDVDSSILTYANNSVVMGMSSLFQDISTFNYRPTATSGFIDTGDVADAPLTDILGSARPYGAGPDRGAYEVGASSSTGGTTSGGTTTGGTTSGGGTSSSGGTGSTGGTSAGGGTSSGGGATGGTGGAGGSKFLRPPKKK